MKKLKKISNILFYAIIAVVAVYVIYVISSLDITKPIENNNVTHVVKDETEEDSRNNNKKDPDPDFQKYVDNIKLNNIINYTTSYDNIELFKDDDLFREGYTKATVFTFLSENGDYLIDDLSKIEIYNSKTSLTTAYKCFEVDNDNVLIIAIVDNNKLKLLEDTEDKLKIKIECMDKDKNYYYAEKDIVKGIIEFEEEVYAGDLFQYEDTSYGIRINNCDDTTAMLKEDLMSNTMRYEFTNSIELFTFGIDNMIDVSELKLDYSLEDLNDFDKIYFVVSAYKLYSNEITEYNGEKGLLCNLKIKIFCDINDTNISEEDIEKYKEIINKATLCYKGIKMPLKQIIIEENVEIVPN